MSLYIERRKNFAMCEMSRIILNSPHPLFFFFVCFWFKYIEPIFIINEIITKHI